MDHSFRNKTISGVIWKAMESGGNQAVRFVISVVLARMLDPQNYTTLALLLIFVNIADVFVKRGFSTALPPPCPIIEQRRNSPFCQPLAPLFQCLSTDLHKQTGDSIRCCSPSKTSSRT